MPACKSGSVGSQRSGDESFRADPRGSLAGMSGRLCGRDFPAEHSTRGPLYIVLHYTAAMRRAGHLVVLGTPVPDLSSGRQGHRQCPMHRMHGKGAEHVFCRIQMQKHRVLYGVVMRKCYQAFACS